MLDFTDFGVYPNTGLDVSAGVATAIAAAKASGGGGNIHAGDGEYIVSGAVGIDLTGAGQIRLHGDGPDRTLFTYTGTGVGVLIGETGGITRKSGIEGICLRQGDGTLRSNIPGNYGILTPNAGTGTGIFIKDCAVVGFRDHAIRIMGPTGPTVVEDVEIYRCAGYGIVLGNYGGLAPQDVSIVRGSIQDIWGGIAIDDGCTSTAVYDTDIELGINAKWPCISIGVGGGHSFHNTSLSAGANEWGNAIVYCAGFGNTFTGGLNFATGNTEIRNFVFVGTNANHNVVSGGHHSNTTGGYFAVVDGGVKNAFVTPDLAPTFAAGKNGVHNTSGSGNSSILLGIEAV